MNTKQTRMFRQGDILIMTADRREGLREVDREDSWIVLARSEATGHAHAIASNHASLLMDDQTLNRYLDVRAPVRIEHKEHREIELPSGFYEVRRQREYRPEGLRSVVD